MVSHVADHIGRVFSVSLWGSSGRVFLLSLCTAEWAGAGLQDFIKLAKWEDRGYYAQRKATEDAQRKLHKFVRKASEVLNRPVAEVLSASERGSPFDALRSSLSSRPPPKGSGLDQQVRRSSLWISLCHWEVPLVSAIWLIKLNTIGVWN